MPTPSILVCSGFCYANKLSRTRAPAIDVSGIVNGDALLLSVDAVAAAEHKHSHKISGLHIAGSDTPESLHVTILSQAVFAVLLVPAGAVVMIPSIGCKLCNNDNSS